MMGRIHITLTYSLLLSRRGWLLLFAFRLFNRKQRRLHFSDQQGEFHSLQAPKWMCEALAQCHPSAWKRGQPPLASDFQQSDWQSRFARFGLAAI